LKLLVDTSVWSLGLRRKKKSDHPADTFLQRNIDEGSNIYLTGLIYQEILQGVRSEIQGQAIKKHLSDFTFLEPTPTIHASAAHLYTDCRKRGITVHTVDCLIAAVSIFYECSLLTTDPDFSHIGKHSDLQLANYHFL